MTNLKNSLMPDTEAMVLAMAYVPTQEWNDIYSEDLALCKGTLFPELDKPFLGRKQVRHG